MEDLFTNPAFVKAALIFGWVLVYGLWLTIKEGRKTRSTTKNTPD